MDRVMKEMTAKDWQQEQRTTELAATEKANVGTAAGFAAREAAVSEREAAMATTQERISELEAEAIERMRHCAELEAKALKEEGEATRLCNEQRTRKEELDSLAQQLDQATQTLADRETKAAEIRHEADQRVILAEGAMKDVAEREKALRTDRQQVESQLADVASQKATLESQGREIAQGQVGLEEMEQDLVQTEADLEARNTELSAKEETFVVEKAEVDSLKVELEQYADEIGERCVLQNTFGLILTRFACFVLSDSWSKCGTGRRRLRRTSRRLLLSVSGRVSLRRSGGRGKRSWSEG